MTENRLDSFLHFLGICRRAGKTVIGCDLVCSAMRQGHMALVLVSAEASPATKKRIGDKCRFYGKDLLEIPADTGLLGHSVGKTGAVAVVGVTDDGFARAIREKADALSG